MIDCDELFSFFFFFFFAYERLIHVSEAGHC